MEDILNFGIQFILWLQSLGSWLTPVMKLFTFLGNEQFYLLVAPAILWCLDSTLGLRLGLFLMLNGTINAALKIIFHDPRPYWYSKEITVSGSAENSFGLPSGHAQNAVVVWGTIARHIKKWWAWVIAILIIILIGISRIYLALHFPTDVLLGWLVGTIMLGLFLWLERPMVIWLKKYNPVTQILIVFVSSLFMILLVVIARLSLGSWAPPADWLDTAQLAFPEERAITPLSYHNILATPATFFGMAAGWIWLTMHGGFSLDDKWWKLLLRYLVGLVGVLTLYIGLGTLFPETETFIAYALRYLRYMLIGFWISGFAPWLFVKLRLSTRLH